MIDWNDLQYVLALRDGGTMKQAAVLLKTNPTTVSRHIKSISAALDVTLFHLEKSGNWVLTPSGENVVGLAETVKNKVDRLKSMSGETIDRKSVTVTSLEFLLTHYIAPQLGERIPEFPDTVIDLVGSDRRLSLAYGQADIALRFGRPEEGQLIASKVASMKFGTYAHIGTYPTEWIGLHEDLDQLPEMQLGRATFGRPPSIRVSSFAAAREASIATGLAAIGPPIVMLREGFLAPIDGIPSVDRDVWSIIHESRRFSQRLRATREWLKVAIATNQKKESQKLKFAHGVPNLKTNINL